MITELEFQSLAAAGYNRIPLIAEAFADLETPLSLYLSVSAAIPSSACRRARCCAQAVS